MIQIALTSSICLVQQNRRWISTNSVDTPGTIFSSTLHSASRRSTFSSPLRRRSAQQPGLRFRQISISNWSPFYLASCYVLYHLFFGNWTSGIECSSNSPRRRSRRSKHTSAHQSRKTAYSGAMSNAYKHSARITLTGSGETTTATLRVLTLSSCALAH